MPATGRVSTPAVSGGWETDTREVGSKAISVAASDTRQARVHCPCYVKQARCCLHLKTRGRESACPPYTHIHTSTHMASYTHLAIMASPSCVRTPRRRAGIHRRHTHTQTRRWGRRGSSNARPSMSAHGWLHGALDRTHVNTGQTIRQTIQTDTHSRIEEKEGVAGVWAGLEARGLVGWVVGAALRAEAVQRAALALEGVDHVKGRDGLAAGVLCRGGVRGPAYQPLARTQAIHDTRHSPV
jgi:hypothetical protein